MFKFQYKNIKMSESTIKFALFLLLTTMMACQSPSKLKSSQLGLTSVKPSILQLVEATNSGDISVLDRLYAKDFKSLSPIHNVPKSVLLQQIKSGFENSKNMIQIQIIEVHQGNHLATAILDWTILNTEKTVIFKKNVQQTWRFEDGRWQLVNVLYFLPEEVMKL